MSPSTSSLSERIFSASYGPRMVELFQSALSSVDETTYFRDSLKNGAPVGPLGRGREHRSPRRLKKRGPRVVVGGPAGRRRHDPPVVPGSQEDRVAPPHDTADGGAHLRIERIVERPGRTVYDAIQRDEFVYEDAAHDRLLGCGVGGPNGSHHRPATA